MRDPRTTDATVGFAFDVPMKQVLLLKKDSRLPTLEGKWNGLGGKIEKNRGESPLEAMVREFKEECGIQTKPEEWRLVAIRLPSKKFGHIYYFTMKTQWVKAAKTLEEEEVKLFSVDKLPEALAPHINWIIQLAYDEKLQPIVFIPVYKDE